MVAALIIFSTSTGTTFGGNAPQPAALKTFLERQGFGGSLLHRRFGNHLFVTAVSNGRPTALMIDSGCPSTVIDRASAHRLALTIKETKGTLTGISGEAQRYGVSGLATMRMGNCTFTNVPIQVANEAEINLIAQPHLDGLFGSHEMARFGMIVDCARQMIYVNPRTPTATTAQKVSQFLIGRGFTRIPMHFNTNHHLEIEAAINGRPTRLVVDTGAAMTLLSAPAAAASGASLSPRFSFQGEGVGHVRQLTLGNLTVPNAEVFIQNTPKFVGAGILGEEYLSWNFAVVDVGGMNLYLRPPEQSGKKQR